MNDFKAQYFMLVIQEQKEQVLEVLRKESILLQKNKNQSNRIYDTRTQIFVVVIESKRNEDKKQKYKEKDKFLKHRIIGRIKIIKNSEPLIEGILENYFSKKYDNFCEIQWVKFYHNKTKIPHDYQSIINHKEGLTKIQKYVALKIKDILDYPLQYQKEVLNNIKETDYGLIKKKDKEESSSESNSESERSSGSYSDYKRYKKSKKRSREKQSRKKNKRYSRSKSRHKKKQKNKKNKEQRRDDKKKRNSIRRQNEKEGKKKFEGKKKIEDEKKQERHLFQNKSESINIKRDLPILSVQDRLERQNEGKAEKRKQISEEPMAQDDINQKEKKKKLSLADRLGINDSKNDK